MLVVEVDVLDAQTRQRLVAAGFDVLRAAIDVKAPIIIPQAELGRENHFVSPISNGASNQALVVSTPIHIGRVKKKHPKLDGPVDRGNRLLFICGSVRL